MIHMEKFYMITTWNERKKEELYEFAYDEKTLIEILAMAFNKLEDETTLEELMELVDDSLSVRVDVYNTFDDKVELIDTFVEDTGMLYHSLYFNLQHFKENYIDGDWHLLQTEEVLDFQDALNNLEDALELMRTVGDFVTDEDLPFIFKEMHGSIEVFQIDEDVKIENVLEFLK